MNVIDPEHQQSKICGELWIPKPFGRAHEDDNYDEVDYDDEIK